MTNDDLKSKLKGKELRDYQLVRMLKVYQQAELKIDSSGRTSLYFKHYERIKRHPAEALQQYDLDLTQLYVNKGRSTDEWKDKIEEIIGELNEGDWSNEPITSPVSVMGEYL